MLKFLKSRYIWIIFVVMIIVQIGVPVYSIIELNDILATGEEFKISTRPIDPADPFMGRYVAVRARIDVSEKQEREWGYKLYRYVSLGKDADGFATVLEISNQPIDAPHVIEVDEEWFYGDVELPIDRYYMQEHLAPEADRMVARGELDAYITIRVKHGKCVISGVYVDGVRIEEYVRANA